MQSGLDWSQPYVESSRIDMKFATKLAEKFVRRFVELERQQIKRLIEASFKSSGSRRVGARNRAYLKSFSRFCSPFLIADIELGSDSFLYVLTASQSQPDERIGLGIVVVPKKREIYEVPVSGEISKHALARAIQRWIGADFDGLLDVIKYPASVLTSLPKSEFRHQRAQAEVKIATDLGIWTATVDAKTDERVVTSFYLNDEDHEAGDESVVIEPARPEHVRRELATVSRRIGYPE